MGAEMMLAGGAVNPGTYARQPCGPERLVLWCADDAAPAGPVRTAGRRPGRPNQSHYADTRLTP